MSRSRFAFRGIVLEGSRPAIEARRVAYLGFALCLLPTSTVVLYSHMYRVFKFRQPLLNGLALLVVAAGMIAVWPPGEA